MAQKKILPALLFALAAAVFPACDKDAPAGPDILPGQGLKEVKIGEKAKDAIDAYGPTTTGYVEKDGQYIHAMNYATLGIVIVLEPTNSPTFDNDIKIRSFQLDAPYSGKTAEGFGIGSNKSEVRSTYGQPEVSDGTTDTYVARGISFRYDANGKAEHIVVAKF